MNFRPAFQHRFAPFFLNSFLLAALALTLSESAFAQQKQASGGVIGGRVYLADNDKPARFATVYLKAVAPPATEDDFFTALMDSSIVNLQNKRLAGASPSSEDESDLKSAREFSKGLLNHVSDMMLSATVSATGDYLFTGVPPGAYYIHVRAPGYIDTLNQFTDDELASQNRVVREKIAATVTIVTVVGTEQVRENLRLERGASVSGRIVFDDGSIAAGWTVRAIPKRNAGTEPAGKILGIDFSSFQIDQRFPTAVTDDTGQFRIAGLPTGEYVLEASFVTAALDRQPFSAVDSSAGSFLSILGGLSELRGLRLSVYSGNTVRLHDAEVLKLRAGEERLNTNLMARLVSTRSVTGFVVSQSDGHTINSGDVELIATNKDGSEDMSTRVSARIQPDGSFRFDYVPAPGAYKLRALHPSDMSAGSTMKLLGSLIAERKTLRGYASASANIDVQDEDVTGVKVAVADLTSSHSPSDQ